MKKPHPSFSEIVLVPKKDAYISEFYPNTNFGDRFYLFANRFQGCGDEYKSLIKFDLCAGCNNVPPNSFIVHATLKLWVFRNEVPANETTDLCVFPIVQSWNELGVTWNNQPNVDFSESYCTTVSPNDINQFITIDVTELVKKWYTGHIVNDGILIQCDENFDSLLAFYSREFENSNFWPRLSIWYGVKCCIEHHKPHSSCIEDDPC